MPLKLLCDENVPRAIDEALKELNYNVARVESGAPDSKVAIRARLEKRILLTFDSDFSNILAYPPQKYYGIIRIRIEPPFIEVVMSALKILFAQFKTQKDFHGRLFIVEATNFRVWG